MVKSKCPKEVIFSGGNFGTISFLGCIQALIDSENFETKNVKRWVGTSGGAVISFLLAIGYNTKTIMKVLKVPLSKISKLTSDKWLTFLINMVYIIRILLEDYLKPCYHIRGLM